MMFLKENENYLLADCYDGSAQLEDRSITTRCNVK